MNEERRTEMDSNTIGTLIYFGVAFVIAIISATIIRFNLSNWERFNAIDVVISMLFGIVWPLTIVAWVVYLVSGLLYSKFFKKYEP